jgi:hypothetical protein
MDLHQNAALTLRRREALAKKVVDQRVPELPANGSGATANQGRDH